MKQESLPGLVRFSAPPNPAKKSKKGGGGGGGGAKPPYAGSFLGTIYPMPLNSDGSHIACPCGRVYLLPFARGGITVFDSEAPLGRASLGVVPVITAKRVLAEKGCRLHVNADARRAPARIAEWRREREGG